MDILLFIGALVSFTILNADTGGNFPPPLSKKKEEELFLRMKNKDEKARNELIEHNLRLVSHIVRKYYGCNNRSLNEDLVSIGTIGLIKAVDSFKCENGARFATYSARCIQNEILMYFRAKKKTQNEVSIFDTIDTDSEGNPLTYMDIVKCEDTIADDLHIKTRALAAIDYIMKMPPGRDKSIMELRYGVGGKTPLTQRETAEKLGISRSYVSRIEKGILGEIKEYIVRTGH